MARPHLEPFSHASFAAKWFKAQAFSARWRGEKVASLVLAGLLIGQVPQAHPATPDDLLDLPLEQLVQIEIPNVVGASKYEQGANKAPSSVSVINAAEIKNYGWLKLSDILRSVRGFTATNDRNYEFLSARGFGLPSDYTSRVLLLIDGLRINDSIFQQATTGGDFPLDVDLIDRVEIIRGPGSALYGSSAFFGVINVITKKGGQFQGGEIELGGGSFDTKFGRVSLGKKFDSGLEILLSGSEFNRNGQQAFFFPAFANDASPEPEFSAQPSITICVSGESSLDAALASLKGKSAQGRNIVIKHDVNLHQLGFCHVVFICSSDSTRVAKILNEVGKGVLTVSDIPAFVDAGGVIGLTVSDNKVAFEVNLEAAQQADLKISAQLLKVARSVRGKPKL